ATISTGSVREHGNLPLAKYGQHAIRCPRNRQVGRTPAATIGYNQHVERAGSAQAQDILRLFELRPICSFVFACLATWVPKMLPPCACRLLRALGNNEYIEVYTPLALKTQARHARRQRERRAGRQFRRCRTNRHLAPTTAW